MKGNSHQVSNKNEKLRRFEGSELVLHWVNAVPFLILVLTGALNILSRFKIFLPPFIETIRTVHKTAAVLWILGIGYSFFFVGRELNIANTRDQFKIGLSDFAWMIKAARSVLNPHIEVPPVGKFNIGQKINALLVLLYAVAFTGSGALIWAYNTMLFPWYFHASIFFVALASLGGHLYLSFVHPSTRPGLLGIFNGMVPRSYIVHHHSLMIVGAAKAQGATAAPAPGVLISRKVERPFHKPGSDRVPDLRIPERRDRQKNTNLRGERISAVQSRSADARAESPRPFQHQQPHLDPDARLLASWYGGDGCPPEENDMQKAWGRVDGMRRLQQSALDDTDGQPFAVVSSDLSSDG